MPLDSPYVKENCAAGFERTSLSSSGAKRPTTRKAECRLYLRRRSLLSAFVVVGCFAPDKERLVLSKPVMQFSLTYRVSRGIFIFVYTSFTSFFIYFGLYFSKFFLLVKKNLMKFYIFIILF